MRTRLLSLCLLSLALFPALGCSDSGEPLSPSEPSATNVTIAPPAAASPAVDEQWGWLEQPVVLTTANAVVTGTSATPVTYDFEVASDPAFTAMVFTARGVAQGSDGKTSVPIDRLATPQFLYWRVKASNGTATSAYSTSVGFELEAQGGHVSPGGFADPSGNPLSEEYAEAIIEGCGDEFPHTLAVYGSEAAAEAAAEELLLRIIWHLKLAGFDAAQQRNPSGAISKDKLNIHIRGTWRTYDIFSLGVAGVPNRITGLGRVFPESPIATDGIPD